MVLYLLMKLNRIEQVLKRFSFQMKLTKHKPSEEEWKLEKISSLNRDTFLWVMNLTVVRYVTIGLQTYLVAQLFGLNISFLTFLLIIPIVQLSLLFAITPGRLGILEGGWYVILILLIVPKENITLFLIGQRTYLYVFISIIFLISYLIFSGRKLISSRKAVLTE